MWKIEIRQTELKPERDGHYRRNIGWLVRGDGKRHQPKIGLGRVKRAAQDRLSRISAIWQRVELQAENSNSQPVWSSLALKVAKAIGKGDEEYLVAPLGPDPAYYTRLVEAISETYPEIAVRPQDEALYRAGKEAISQKLVEIEAVERDLLAFAGDIKSTVLETPGNERKYVDLLAEQTLHQALTAYSDHVEKEKFDSSEGAINDTGKRKQYMVQQLKTYLDDRPLQSLTDFSSVDQVYGVLRNRPITFRYDKPMAHKSASHLIGELSQFFDWLHLSPKWDWREPLDYHRISRKPLDLEADGDHETQDVPTYTMAQLKTLFKYATPLERLLILLGINCAFGADQIGRMRIGEMLEKNGRYYIQRIRKKKRVKGTHVLFGCTVEGIKWATRGREDQPLAHVLVNGKGNSLWRKTKGGNRSKDIPNAWYRLLDRIEVDHPGFPRNGFNTLRDTSADFIRKIGGEEVASMHLTHRHQSSDRNLRRYTNQPLKRLFQAQRKLERRLVEKEVFTLEDDPWKDREHQYVTESQKSKMRAMAKEGVAVAQIAREVGVATTTVYRWANPKRKSKATT